MWEGNQSHEEEGESYLQTIEVYVSSAPKHQVQKGQQTNEHTDKKTMTALCFSKSNAKGCFLLRISLILILVYLIAPQ